MMEDRRQGGSVMCRKIKNRLQNQAGLTLVEILVVVLILMMATLVVAAGVPVAVNAYDRVVDTGNAQVLLSTSVVRLREELCTATGISRDGDTISYTNADGNAATIEMVDYNPASDNYPGVTLTVRYYEWTDEGRTTHNYSQLLVSDGISKSVTAKTMYLTYSINPADFYEDGIITLHDLKVKKAGDATPLAELDYLQIKVLNPES